MNHGVCEPTLTLGLIANRCRCIVDADARDRERHLQLVRIFLPTRKVPADKKANF